MLLEDPNVYGFKDFYILGVQRVWKKFPLQERALKNLDWNCPDWKKKKGLKISGP
jgi:hypothetical protein